MRAFHSSRKITSLSHASASRSSMSGFSHSLIIFVCCLSFGCAGLYLYSINKSSVQGYAMRSLEQEIQQLRKENGELRVREAEVRALSVVEKESQTLRMEKIQNVDTLTLSNAIAIR